MTSIPLYHVYEYRERDRAFWEEHLEDWVPRRVVDTHLHFVNPETQIETVSEEMLRRYWVIETYTAIDAADTERIAHILFPGRDVCYLGFGFAHLGWDILENNRYVREEGLRRGWPSLAVIDPRWVAEQVEHELKQPGCVGLKPYYSMIRYNKFLTASFQEADIFDFLPHHQLEVADQYHAWCTLHVPKADRLGHPSNIRQIKEIRRRYPNVKLVIAHLGRCYTEPHAREGILPLADEEGLYWDCSAVFNPASYRIALTHLGPERVMWGSDNPVFYMRGRRQFNGRSYIDRTDYPFHFNKEREAPEIEAQYTIYTYEALRMLKDLWSELGLSERQRDLFFHETADRLIDDVLSRKGERLPRPASSASVTSAADPVDTERG